VVQTYNTKQALFLTAAQMADLAQYLKSLWTKLPSADRKVAALIGLGRCGIARRRAADDRQA